MNEESISIDELKYHIQVLKYLSQSQVIVNFWSQHLKQKYNLSDTDSIGEDGKIIRVQSN